MNESHSAGQSYHPPIDTLLVVVNADVAVNELAVTAPVGSAVQEKVACAPSADRTPPLSLTRSH